MTSVNSLFGRRNSLLAAEQGILCNLLTSQREKAPLRQQFPALRESLSQESIHKGRQSRRASYSAATALTSIRNSSRTSRSMTSSVLGG
jgi:hypothetical protein